MNNPHLPAAAGPATDCGMTRTSQTYWIVGAIIAVGMFLAFVLWPEPNLDGMRPIEKCKYSSYYKTHGGSYQACYDREIENATNRLMRGF